MKWITASPTELSSCTFCLQVAPVTNSCLWPNLFLQRGRKKCTGTPLLLTPTLDCPLDNRMLLGPRVATPKDKKKPLWPMIRWILYVLLYLSCLLWPSAYKFAQILSKLDHKPKQNNIVLMSVINTNCHKNHSNFTLFPLYLQNGKH